jgi:hypothetical protein
MPQHRAKAFSGKQKKQQLKNKKQRSVLVAAREGTLNGDEFPDEFPNLPKVSAPVASGDNRKKLSKSEKYKLLFQYDTKEFVHAAKVQSQEKIIRAKSIGVEININDIYDDIIDFPKRPDWKGETNPKKINEIETEEFEKYLHRIHSAYNIESLSYFEHNIETWRQLWRALELRYDNNLYLFIKIFY